MSRTRSAKQSPSRWQRVGRQLLGVRLLDLLMVGAAVVVVAALLAGQVEHRLPPKASAPRRLLETRLLETHPRKTVHRPSAPRLLSSTQTSRRAAQHPRVIQLCQYGEPVHGGQGGVMFGVDSRTPTDGLEATWRDWQPIPWQMFSQGEYVGPERMAHVPEYRLRVDDLLEFVYRITRNESAQPYELNVGDRIRIETIADKSLDRELVIQPDGTITLQLLGQVHAARRTVKELTADLERQFQRFFKVPSVTVTPISVNTKLNDLRAVVDNRYGRGGQGRQAKVTPEGTVQLPAVGSVFVQGLSIEELNREIDERYRAVVDGIEVTPVLVQRAPRYVYVLGEVAQPGRYTLEAPTTAMQAIALAGGWNNGGNLRQVVIFRRTADWRLMATKLDLYGALLGARPSPADEIWLRDSDLVIVPKSPILLIDDFIELVFTRGAYGAVPFQGISLNFTKASTL